MATGLGLLLLVAALVFTAGISDNGDWLMYYYMFKMENEDIDVMFQLLTQIFKWAGLKYDDLYMFHIVLIILLFFTLISRLTRNVFYVFLIYILLDYVHLTNQIRYYFGFPLMIMGLHQLLQRKNYALSFALMVLALLFHKGLFLLLLFIPAYYFVSSANFIRVMMLLSGVFPLLILGIRAGLGVSLEHFDNYLGSEYEASVVGGVFNALPYLAYLVFLLIEYGRFRKKNADLATDEKMDFLMKLSFFPLMFLPASFLLQIIGHRYIMPFSIFWVIFYLRLIRDLPARVRFLKMLLFSGVHLAALVSIYILPDFFFRENHYIEEIKVMLKSIPYLQNLL